MENRISATHLARRLGDVLGRIRYRGDSFVIERNGDPVARIVPVPGKSLTTVRQALAAWRAAGKPDPAVAADLERIVREGATGRPPRQQGWRRAGSAR